MEYQITVVRNRPGAPVDQTNQEADMITSFRPEKEDMPETYTLYEIHFRGYVAGHRIEIERADKMFFDGTTYVFYGGNEVSRTLNAVSNAITEVVRHDVPAQVPANIAAAAILNGYRCV